MGGDNNANSLLSKIGDSDHNNEIEVCCKVFFIVDDDTASEYAKLLTLIKNNNNYFVLESESAWNQDGEMTKIITYEIHSKVRKSG